METDKSNSVNKAGLIPPDAPPDTKDTIEEMVGTSGNGALAANGKRHSVADHPLDYITLTIGGERFRKDKKHNHSCDGEDMNPGYIELTVGGHKIEEAHNDLGYKPAKNHNRYVHGLLTVGGNNLFESPRTVMMTVGGNRILFSEKAFNLRNHPRQLQKKYERSREAYSHPNKTANYSSLAASQ